jgi:hypothetical protein
MARLNIGGTDARDANGDAMTRLFALALSLLVALPLGTRSATAFEGIFSRHPKIDRRVATTATGAGVVSTVTYWSLLDWKWSGHSSSYQWGVWGGVTAGCIALSPMIAAAMVPERHLTTREVLVLQGGCLIPVVGGWLVNAMFDANPHWEAHERAVKVAAKPRRRAR